MRVSERSIAAIGKIATGDVTRANKSIAPYSSGPQLVQFFKEFGSNVVYAPGFPSRWQFAEEQIREHNGSPSLAQVIQALLDPQRYLDSDFTPDQATEYLNQYLRYDEYEVCKVGNSYRVRDINGVSVNIEPSSFPVLSHPFIDEQLEKCDAKIASSDYYGAVTNARTLVEAVLIAIESGISDCNQPYDGDIQRLFRRVQKLLDIEPNRKDISEPIRAVMSGLANIVHGLAPLRNKMSDAHPAVYPPAKRHAKLAVNAAKTLVGFLFEEYEYKISALEI